ncbi:MAG: helix-turn-helix domain-containing protein, partial [Acidobacteriota bacterium]|nr:helix-turn-helix domain-containing protein [Acidobacteriota bacterium]
MRENLFNIYYLLAGPFIQYWLLSRREISGGAKLVYSVLAQQANSRGATQLHSQMTAVSLGIDEGQLARHLMELEEVGLVQVSRGNLHPEDLRVYFPLHPWLTVSENDQAGPSSSDR